MLHTNLILKLQQQRMMGYFCLQEKLFFMEFVQDFFFLLMNIVNIFTHEWRGAGVCVCGGGGGGGGDHNSVHGNRVVDSVNSENKIFHQMWQFVLPKSQHI